MVKIGINGFGRIGRAAARVIFEKNLPVQIVGINDLSENDILSHLFQFDSTFGKFFGTVNFGKDFLEINNQKIKTFSERNPENIDWKGVGADVILECTGVFRTRELAENHLKSGAKKVVISAPAKGEVDGTFVIGVNEKNFDLQKHKIISNASCTTNCLAPVAKILDENFGIQRGLMTTIHSFTGDQRILDAPHRDFRRARTASESMIPTSTGAAKAVGLVLPNLLGRLNGIAIRVPTSNVSLVDLTVELKNKVSSNDINEVVKKEAEGRLKGILEFEEKPLVSRDFLKNSHSSIFDASQTMVIENTVKVLSWYDNEWGYSNRLVDLAIIAGGE